jgi:hypothetical protein
MAISAEQTAAIWGCGAQSNSPPFTDINGIQQRSATSGTQIQVARNIGVAESAFRGNANGSSSGMLNSLVNYPNPQATIGFIAADFYATHRSSLNSVAFRGKGQKMAYYADSDSISTDLLNVREGRYMIQGPLHFFASVDGTGAASAVATAVLGWLTGAVAIDPGDPGSYVRTVATNGDVPQCAMKVKISTEAGVFSRYTPPVSCNCAFMKSKSLPIPAGTCPVCKSDTDCTGGLHCQTGYCE